MIRVPVPLGERSYDVLVGRAVRDRLVDVLPAGARRAAIVTQATIPWPVDPGVEHETFVVGDGEEAKTLHTIEDLCRRFSRWGLTRSDVVIGVGGGVVAAVLVALSLWLLREPVGNLSLLYQSAFELRGLGIMGAMNLVILGGLLGLAGAWLAVTRHLAGIEPR